MIDSAKFTLVHELLNNMILFGKNNNIILAGIRIKEKLINCGINLDGIPGVKIYVESKYKSLGDSIGEVRKNKKFLILQFETLKDDFFLFPANSDDESIVILSTGEKIIQLSQIEHDSKERVKELECLYNISHELEKSRVLDEVINNTIPHLIKGFEFPEFTSVRFELDGVTYGDQDHKGKKTKNVLKENIVKNKKKRGSISVSCHKQAEFSEEGEKLLKEVARKLSRALERIEETISCENQRKKLLFKNKTLIKLTDECNRRREQLRTFLSAIEDIIFVIDPEFNIILSNKKKIGDSGKCYKKVFQSDHVCKDCPALRTFKNSNIASLERKNLNRDYLLHSYPILKDGKVESVLEVCRDTTKEKEMEFQLLQSYKLASLGKLVTGIAHEVNNPNTFILGNIKIIKEAFEDIMPILDINAEKNKNLKIAQLDYDIFRENIPVLLVDIENGANRMKKIVQDLRNYARKDEGLLTEKVDLNQTIINSLRLVKNEIKQYAKVRINLCRELPIFIGNIQKIEQVIVNLLINASEAIDHDNGIIEIATELDTALKQINLKISDNGIGMDKNTKNCIFDPFFTTKRDQGGTGLGLSITYGIVKEHNADIEVETKLGSGTTFTIKIPVTTD
jgi:signal transduction histidine kinase/PAS domain-containing protein